MDKLDGVDQSVNDKPILKASLHTFKPWIRPYDYTDTINLPSTDEIRAAMRKDLEDYDGDQPFISK